MNAVVIDVDVWPRTPEYRYRLYARRGRDLEVLCATPSMCGIGAAIEALDGDARDAGVDDAFGGQVGVLDCIECRWIVNPFPRTND